MCNLDIFFVLTNNKGTLHSEPLCLNILNLALVLSTTTIKWSGVRRTSSITNNFFFCKWLFPIITYITYMKTVLIG